MDLQQIPDDFKFYENEEKILKYWLDNDIYKKIVEKNNKSKPFYNLDGPAFVSAPTLHTGHCLVGFIKSCFLNFMQMQGYNVHNKIGYDTHGIPVEMQINKQLNIHTKKEILSFGLDKYNQACKEMIHKYSGAWQPIYNRIGRFLDFTNEYKTMDTNFMESTWWIFKQLWEKKLIYKGYKIMPFSTKCATPLSNFEASDNYKDVQDPALYVKFQLNAEPNTFVIAWTTTPWTLPSNLALCMNENFTYVKVLDKKNNEYYILAESCLDNLYGKDKKVQLPYEVIAKYTGKDFKNKEYTPLFDYYSYRTFKIICDDFVSSESGTGVVHLAAAFGNDDFEVCIKNNIVTEKEVGTYCPVDDDGKFTSAVKDYEGMHVLEEANVKIMQRLKDEKKSIKKENYSHSYPFCWRTDTPLIYKSTSSFFVDVPAIKDKLVANNKKINWVPQNIGSVNVHQWLENAKPWGISRSRFFGTPLPIWETNDGDMLCIGSIDELVELAGLKTRPTDIHLEFIKDIKIVKNGKEYHAVNLVLDCIVEGTPISLHNGTSLPIEYLKTCKSNVLGFDNINKGLVMANTSVFKDRGTKECIELLLEDGRTLQCTGNHRILTMNDKSEVVWKQAKDLILNETRIVCSVDYPSSYIHHGEEIIEEKWKLNLGYLQFSTNNMEEKLKSMAFARILGYMLTDGSFSKTKKTGQIRAVGLLGHKLDSESFANDVKLVCGIYPSINYDKTRHIYYIYLPVILRDALLLINGIKPGKRIYQDAELPAFILDKNNICPKAIKCEFLGGMFGGDGYAPSLSYHGKNAVLTTASLIASKVESKINTLKLMFEQIKTILAEFNIKQVTISSATETTASNKNKLTDKKLQITLIINHDPETVITFGNKIGYRYCVHKQIRLSLAVAWRRLQLSIYNQNNKILKRVDELTRYSEVLNNAESMKLVKYGKLIYIKKNILMTVKDAREQAIKEFKKNEVIISDEYLISLVNCYSHLRNKTGKYTCNTIPPDEWLKSVNGLKFFMDEKDYKNLKGKQKARKTTYGIDKNAIALPTFGLKLIGKNNIGKKQVYDITVPKYESFVANGLVVHNCWFESGSVPYGQIHYPFENSNAFDGQDYISDFVAEGREQFKLWFYTLNVISTALFDKPAFKNVICAGMIMGDDGKKMSKRLGNYIDPMEVVKQFSSDACRMYLMNSPAAYADSFIFKQDDIMTVSRKNIQLLNAVKFFIEHTIKFQKDGNNFNINAYKQSTNMMDIWILSRQSSCLNNIITNMNQYKIYQVIPEITDFIEELTNWYIKFNRNRLRGRFTNLEDRTHALSTLYHVLMTFSQVIAPFMPFLAETLYKKLKVLLSEEKQELSVHMCTYPVNKDVIDSDIINKMQKLQTVSKIVRAIRSKPKKSNIDVSSAKIPLKLIKISATQDAIDDIKELERYLKEEINVMNVEYDLIGNNSKYVVVPNQKSLGSKYKSLSTLIKQKLETLSQEDIIIFVKTKELKIKIQDKEIILTSDDITINQTFVENADPNFMTDILDNIMVTVDFTQDEQLINYYMMRLFVVMVQKMRKNTNLKPWNEITIYYATNSDKIKKMITTYRARIVEELLYEVYNIYTDKFDQTKEIIIAQTDKLLEEKLTIIITYF